MGRNNNNAGLHVIPFSSKNGYDEFADDYNFTTHGPKKYNNPEYRHYMDEKILENTSVVGTKKMRICEWVSVRNPCRCGGKLERKQHILVYYHFEKGRDFRYVEGYRCKRCGSVFLVKKAILPALKKDFIF